MITFLTGDLRIVFLLKICAFLAFCNEAVVCSLELRKELGILEFGVVNVSCY